MKFSVEREMGQLTAGELLSLYAGSIGEKAAELKKEILRRMAPCTQSYHSWNQQALYGQQLQAVQGQFIQ